MWSGSRDVEFDNRRLLAHRTGAGRVWSSGGQMRIDITHFPLKTGSRV